MSNPTPPSDCVHRFSPKNRHCEKCGLDYSEHVAGPKTTPPAAAASPGEESEAKATPEDDAYQAAWRDFIERRGVRDPCPRCHGLGVIVYGSGATWRGGIGGATMTNDVCNVCWGSGDKDRPWLNLKTCGRAPAAPSERVIEERWAVLHEDGSMTEDFEAVPLLFVDEDVAARTCRSVKEARVAKVRISEVLE